MFLATITPPMDNRPSITGTLLGSGTDTGVGGQPGTPGAQFVGTAKAGTEEAEAKAIAVEATNKAFFNIGTQGNLLEGMKNTEVWLLLNQLGFY